MNPKNPLDRPTPCMACTDVHCDHDKIDDCTKYREWTGQLETDKACAVFIEQLFKAANSTLFDHSGATSSAVADLFFRQHRYLQNEVLLFIEHILEKIGKHYGDLGYVDARNEWGMKWAADVRKLRQ